jgi:hypothetical protein
VIALTRRRRRIAIALGVIVFLAISFDLARWLSLENLERTRILAVLQAEARGERAAILARLHDCTPACRADVRYDAAHLRKPGTVQILADSSQTAYALTSETGWTRIAWKSSLQRLPVVQCFVVARRGNAVSGLSVTLLRVSRPIHPTTADC